MEKYHFSLRNFEAQKLENLQTNAAITMANFLRKIVQNFLESNVENSENFKEVKDDKEDRGNLPLVQGRYVD